MVFGEHLKIKGNTKEMEKTSRDLKAKRIRESRANRPKPYLVYAGYVGNTCVYVGSGKEGKEEHLNSGISNIYQANQVHFKGKHIEVKVLESCVTKKRVGILEKRYIQQLKPVWNTPYVGDSILIRKYGKVLRDLANDMGYRRKKGVSGLLCAASKVVNDEGICHIGGHLVLPARVTHPTKCLARILKYYSVDRSNSYMYTLYLDTEFMDEVEKNTNAKGQIIWTKELKQWGVDRAYTNGYTKVKERG